MRNILLIFLLTALLSCDKPDNCCSNSGLIRKGSTIGLTTCPNELFIVMANGAIIQPVKDNNLLTGYNDGESVRFGYRRIFLGMRSCGQNVVTAELLCIMHFKSSKSL